MENVVASRPFWKERTVFVTGCSGFLGSWTVQELLAQGARVVGLVRDRVPDSLLATSGAYGRIATVQGDIADYFLLERALGEYEIDTVFHLAAQAIVGAANVNPMATFEANIKGTWALLEACRRNPRVKRVLVASSDKAYGDQEKLPYEESDPLRGLHPYDVSKSCADLIAGAYHHTYGVPVCITRCGNLFGGGDLNFNRVIPGTIKSAHLGERPIIRSDGTYVRDYIYVRDAVDAYLLLAERMEELSLAGSAFNFSNETQVTVLELVETILELMNRADLRPRVLNEAQAEIKHQYLSAAKAREILNWRPRHGLRDGLVDTIAWYRKHFDAVPVASEAP